MIVTVASFKGGVGKTTSAVHLAAVLSAHGSTVLVDGDLNRSATMWGRAGRLPYPIVDEKRIARAAREYEHLVIDTQARPSGSELRDLAEGCDLLVIPCTPDALALDALMQTVEALDTFGAAQFRILLTIIPPAPSKDGEEARQTLEQAGLPQFSRGIRRFAAFSKAALSGCLVRDVPEPRGRLGWDDYDVVGKELIR